MDPFSESFRRKLLAMTEMTINFSFCQNHSLAQSKEKHTDEKRYRSLFSSGTMASDSWLSYVKGEFYPPLSAPPDRCSDTMERIFKSSVIIHNSLSPNFLFIRMTNSHFRNNALLQKCKKLIVAYFFILFFAVPAFSAEIDSESVGAAKPISAKGNIETFSLEPDSGNTAKQPVQLSQNMKLVFYGFVIAVIIGSFATKKSVAIQKQVDS